MADIRYQTYSVGELVELAETSAASPNIGNTPISVQRARSHAANPAANPTDPALMVAWADDRCVGYLGVMPATFWRDDALHKVFCATTLLVDPTFRGNGIARKLVEQSGELEVDYILAGPTPAADRLYSRNPEILVRDDSLEFARVLLFPPAAALFALEARWPEGGTPFAVPLLRRLERRVSRTFVRRLMQKAVWPSPGRGFPAIEARRVDRITAFGDDEPCPSPGSPPQFVRTTKYVNWVLDNPWIEEGPVSDQTFYFSQFRELFRYVCFEFFDRATGEAVGFAVYNVSSRRGVRFLKIVFHHCTRADYEPLVLETAGVLAREYDIDLLVAPIDVVGWSAGRPLLRRLIQRTSRVYFFHRKSEGTVLTGPGSGLGWQFADGDIAFN